jgi:predicted small metal-binding protein
VLSEVLVIVKTFTCGQVVPGRSAAFTADQFEDLLAQIAVHAEQEHGVAPLPPGVVDAVTEFWQRGDADTASR